MTKIATIIGGNGKMGKWLWQYLENQQYSIKIHSRTSRSSKYPFYPNLEDAVKDASLIIVATPISTTQDIYAKLITTDYILKQKPIIVDIMSIKSPLMSILRTGQSKNLNLVSTHPLCGPDTHPKDAKIVVMDLGKPKSTTEIINLYEQLGSSVISIKLEEHDLLMSAVLGIPHLINHLFFDILGEVGISNEMLRRVTGTSLRAQANIATSIANEDPQLYYSILADNPNTNKVLEIFIERIKGFQRIFNSDEDRSDAEQNFRKIMAANKNRASSLGIENRTARRYFLSAPKFHESEE